MTVQVSENELDAEKEYILAYCLKEKADEPKTVGKLRKWMQK
jgi:hypothetical protein